MVQIVVDESQVIVRLTGKEKLYAVRRDFGFPVAAITACSVMHEPIEEVRGIKSPGAGFPNKKIGTWRGTGYKDFVCVSRGEPGFMFELADQEFSRVLLSVSDIDAVSGELSARGVALS